VSDHKKSNVVNSDEKEKRFAKNLEEKLSHDLRRGALLDGTIPGLYRTYRRRFARRVQPSPILADQDAFSKKVSELIWTKDVLASLRDTMKHRFSIEKFREYNRYIPSAIVKEKVKWLSGVSNANYNPAETLHGIGRLTDVENVKDGDIVLFDATSNDKPYETAVKGSSWNVAVLNGANLGLQYNPLIEDNPVRCALAYARHHQYNGMVCTNMLWFDFKKAGGPMRVYKALISGLNTNLDILSPSYQPVAKRILKELPDDEVIYETTAESFLNLASGWYKIARRPNGKGPEFPGQVYGIITFNEEALMMTAAYWAVGYITKRKQSKIAGELKIARRTLAKFEKEKEKREKTKASVEDLNREIAKYQAQIEVLRDLAARTAISNVRGEDLQRFYKKMRTFVVKKLEEAIPNLKVVGQGITYLKFGEKVVEFHIPNHVRVTDSLLANYTNHYGPRVLRNAFPETAVICHPYALNYRMTAREADGKGKRGSAQVFVAPILVDDTFLRDAMKDSVYMPHQLAQAIYAGQFRPGMLLLSCVDNYISADSISVGTLVSAEGTAGAVKREYTKSPDHIWVMTATDPHWGSRAKEFIWDQDNRKYLGMCEAAIEMMRRAGLCNGKKLPIHLFNVNDDLSQGNHYQTQQQPHPKKMSYTDIARALAKTGEQYARATPEKRREIFRSSSKFFLSQLNLRGEDWTSDQLQQLFKRHIDPNLDFFDGVLSRATEAGLVVKGMSAFDEEILEGVAYDGRDVGIINIGSGNHIAATVNKEVSEGRLYIQSLYWMLQTLPKWSGQDELLEKLLKAPLYSNEFMAWGTIKIPGGYEWGLAFRDSPARLSSWGDTLLAEVRSDEKRGNYTRILEGKMTLKTYGDKHFYGAVATEHSFYHMCASGTATDLYGERGFPPNNTGVSFVGLPVHGPESGPILLRTLRYDQLKAYFDKPHKFDWEAFLPNPA